MTIEEYLYIYVHGYPDDDDEVDEELTEQELIEENKYEYREEFWEYEDSFYND